MKDDLRQDKWETRIREYERRRKRARREREKKTSFIGELVECYDRGDDLLEKLRTKEDFDYRPTIGEDFEQLIYLIERYSSKFPLKLRPAMAEAKRHVERIDDEITPDAYYFHFRESVWNYFVGKPIRSGMEGTEDSSWHGPNADYDTEEEIELVLRLCPDIFAKKFEKTERFLDTIDIYYRTTKAVRFIPLLVDLSYYNHQGMIDFAGVTSSLLNNEYAVTPEHHEESLRAFLLVPGKKLIDDDREFKELSQQFLLETINSSRSTAFIKKGLQAMFTVYPTLLKAEGNHCSLLLQIFEDYNYCNLDCEKEYDEDSDDKVGLELYDMMLDLGMLVYKNEVLLAFAGQNFILAREVFGEGPVEELIHDKIKGVSEQSNNKSEKLLHMISEAAADKSINVDGVYSLIRYDPSVLQDIVSKK